MLSRVTYKLSNTFVSFTYVFTAPSNEHPHIFLDDVWLCKYFSFIPCSSHFHFTMHYNTCTSLHLRIAERTQLLIKAMNSNIEMIELHYVKRDPKYHSIFNFAIWNITAGVPSFYEQIVTELKRNN